MQNFAGTWTLNVASGKMYDSSPPSAAMLGILCLILVAIQVGKGLTEGVVGRESSLEVIARNMFGDGRACNG